MSSPPSARKKRSTPIPRKQDLDIEPVAIDTSVTPIHSGLPTQFVANGEAFKTIVIGNANVGKTRMTHLYVNG